MSKNTTEEIEYQLKTHKLQIEKLQKQLDEIKQQEENEKLEKEKEIELMYELIEKHKPSVYCVIKHEVDFDKPRNSEISQVSAYWKEDDQLLRYNQLISENEKHNEDNDCYSIYWYAKKITCVPKVMKSGISKNTKQKNII